MSVKNVIDKKMPALSSFYRNARDYINWKFSTPTTTGSGFRMYTGNTQEGGYGEAKEIEKFKSVIEKCDVFLDIGANVGFFHTYIT
jgi:hypothetical protein